MGKKSQYRTAEAEIVTLMRPDGRGAVAIETRVAHVWVEPNSKGHFAERDESWSAEECVLTQDPASIVDVWNTLFDLIVRVTHNRPRSMAWVIKDEALGDIGDPETRAWFVGVLSALLGTIAAELNVTVYREPSRGEVVEPGGLGAPGNYAQMLMFAGGQNA